MKKYSIPEIKIARFGVIRTTDDELLYPQNTSPLSEAYDTSVTYAQLIAAAAEAAAPVLKYRY